MTVTPFVIVLGIVVSIFTFAIFYEYFSSLNRVNVLKKRGWIKTKVDGVIGFEKNHHFISEKRLKIMSSKSFFTRLEVGNNK